MTLRWWQVCTGDTRWRTDNEGLWHSHHLLTCTDDVLMTCQWSMCNSLCVPLPMWLATSLAEKRTHMSSRMSRGKIFFSTCWVMRILVSMWHSPLSVQWVRHIPCWLYRCTHCLYTQCTCVHPVPDNTLSSEETSTRSAPVIIALWEQVKQWDHSSFTIDWINHCKNQKSQRVIVRCDQYASKVTR